MEEALMKKKNDAVKVMIEQNNQLRCELNDENKAYYEQLLLYIRTAGIFYDDFEVETLLMQILQDIRSAQEEGQTAAEFFGKSAQKAADAMIRNLGKASKYEILKLTGLIFAISSFFVVLNVLTSPGKGINFIVLILNGLLSYLIIILIFFVLHRMIYTKIFKRKVVGFIVLWLVCCAVLGLFILIYMLSPDWLTVYVPDPAAIAIISIFLIAVTVMMLRRKKEERKIWWSFMPWIYIMVIIGIALRLPVTKAWMASNQGKITSAVSVGVGLILFWMISYFYMRERKA
jgi:Uncharacterized membrane-bound protein conserved in bacteria